MLKYNLRGPLRRVQEFLATNHGFNLGVKGINDALIRVGSACSSEYLCPKGSDPQIKMSLDRLKMDKTGKRYDPNEELHKPVECIRNGLGSRFACLLYPGMGPTNSLAEQAIREHVVIRKIIGIFRTDLDHRTTSISHRYFQHGG